MFEHVRQKRSKARAPSWVRWTCQAWWLVVVLWTVSLQADSDELWVVVHSSNPIQVIDANALRPIFQTSQVSWDHGERIEPVNLPQKHAARLRFDLVVLGLDEAEAQRYWIDRKVRGGARPPRKLASIDAVLAHVAASKGGIGYVPTGRLPSGVKAVARVTRNGVRAP